MQKRDMDRKRLAKDRVALEENVGAVVSPLNRDDLSRKLALPKMESLNRSRALQPIEQRGVESEKRANSRDRTETDPNTKPQNLNGVPYRQQQPRVQGPSRTPLSNLNPLSPKLEPSALNIPTPAVNVQPVQQIIPPFSQQPRSKGNSQSAAAASTPQQPLPQGNSQSTPATSTSAQQQPEQPTPQRRKAKSDGNSDKKDGQEKPK